MCCLFGFIDYNHNLSGKQNALNFNSLRKVAEQVQGTFVFTVLDAQDITPSACTTSPSRASMFMLLPSRS